MQVVTSSTPERLAFSYAEAAKMLGLSSRTVWALVAAGELRCFRTGRAVRIPRAEIERYVSARLEMSSPST